MGLNMSRLKGMQEQLNKGGGEGFLNQKDLKEENDIRILIPHPNLDGEYFVKATVWWINKKKYVSPITFGRECPIELEIQEARESGDEDVLALIDDEDKIAQRVEYLIPVLHLDCEFNDDGSCSKYTVKSGKPKTMVAGKGLMKEINRVITSRNVTNGTEWGALDRKKGFCLLVQKTGTGKNTEYKASAWSAPLEIDAKWYELEQVPDVLEMTKKELKSDKFLTSVIRNYLYGEEMAADNKAADTKKTAEPAGRGGSAKSTTNTRGGSSTAVTRGGGKAKVEEIEEEEQQDEDNSDEQDNSQAGKRTTGAAKNNAGTGRGTSTASKNTGRSQGAKRSLADDLENDD